MLSVYSNPYLVGIVDAGVLRDDDCWSYTPTLAVELGDHAMVRLVLEGAVAA